LGISFCTDSVSVNPEWAAGATCFQFEYFPARLMPIEKWKAGKQKTRSRRVIQFKAEAIRVILQLY
jgi:hypothetical protein